MRFVATSALLVSALAGCDVLFQLREVDNTPVDAPPMAPPHCQPPAASAWNVTTLGAGTYYTFDRSATTAVFVNNGMIYETAAGSLSTATRLFPGIAGLEAPRLAPDGTQLFMRLAVPCCSIVSSTKQADGTWTDPVPVPIKILVIGTTDDPGIPSAGIGAKRRMLISNSQTDDFFELREDADGWTQVAAYKDQTLGMIDIQDGDLSPDGYRMYFGGVQAGMTNQEVFMVERSDLTVPFDVANVVLVRDTGQASPGVRTPYISDDCKTLVFSIGSVAGSTVRYGTAP